jgi:hypothetical protein
MEPIFVPKPAKSAFNKNRRVSDLLMGQLKHFQHVEQTSGVEIAAALSRDVHTENGAARYITAMTRAIKAQSAQSKSPMQTASNVIPLPRAQAGRRAKPGDGLSIAAGATDVKGNQSAPRATSSRKRKKP